MFDEKDEEFSVKQGKNVPVFQSAKYLEAKRKAQEIIESKKYDLSESDFWILMNETKSGKMMYSGLIISHNGCLKINDKLEDDLKFNPDCVTLDKEGFGESLVYTYINSKQGIYEVGEVSKSNCKNSYPYAMALKRCMDRVILKNCKLAYAGVYSDAEADEFQQPVGEVKEEKKKDEKKKDETVTAEQVKILLGLFEEYEKKTGNYTVDALIQHTLDTNKIKDLKELKVKTYTDILRKLKTDLGGK